MSEIGRRAFAAIVGSGAFVFFDNTYRSDGGSTGGNATATEEADIRLEDAILNVVEDSTSSDVTVSVDVDAVNYGTIGGTQLVEFRDQVETLEERSVAVDAGATEPQTFEEIYQSITESDVTLDVTNDTTPPQVALNLPRSDIQFSNATITDDTGTVISEIQEGQTFFVSGDVENFGAIGGEKTYVLYGDSDQIDSTTVNLSPGATATIELSHTYNDLGLAAGETSKPIDLSVNEQGVGEISVFAPAIPDGAIDDFESADLVVENEDWSDWSKIQGDSLSAQQSVVLEGSYSGELAANSADTRWQTTRSSEAQRSDFRYDFQISEQNGDSGDFHLFRLFGSGSDFVQFFSRQDGSIDINANTGVASWSADTRYRLNLSNIDYSNENLDVEILDVDASSSLYSATDVSFNESASGLDEVVVGHKNSNSGTTGSTFIDLVGWPPE